MNSHYTTASAMSLAHRSTEREQNVGLRPHLLPDNTADNQRKLVSIFWPWLFDYRDYYYATCIFHNIVNLCYVSYCTEMSAWSLSLWHASTMAHFSCNKNLDSAGFQTSDINIHPYKVPYIVVQDKIKQRNHSKIIHFCRQI